MLKQNLRKKVSSVASIIEITLSILILLIIIVTGIELFMKLFAMISGLFLGKNSWNYRVLFDIAIELIIAIEFVKMLSKHSMGSAIEVLVFVIAKRVIIDGSNATALDVILFVLAFGILFAVRKYLHMDNAPMGEAMVYSAKTSVTEICKLYKTTIPAELGQTIGQAVESCLTASGRAVAAGEQVAFKGFVAKVETVQDNAVESISK